MNLKSDDIQRCLLAELENGIYPVGSRFPAESMLADRFGVNKSTVNRAVNELTTMGMLQRGVRGAGTKVLQTHLFPRGCIGFVSPLNDYTCGILAGAQEAAWARRYLMIPITPKLQDFSATIKMFSEKVCGILFAQYAFFDLPSGYPAIYVDQDLPDFAVHLPSVNINNFAGGEMMMEEVLRRHHREVVVFSSMRDNYLNNSRYVARVRGFHAAMKRWGILDFEGRTFLGQSESFLDAKCALKEILAKYPKTTVIVTDVDSGAKNIILAAMQLNVNCPGKICLTGFGNTLGYPLPTVNQHPERIGANAVNLLINAQEKAVSILPLREKLPVELIYTEAIPIL